MKSKSTPPGKLKVSDTPVKVPLLKPQDNAGQVRWPGGQMGTKIPSTNLGEGRINKLQ